MAKNIVITVPIQYRELTCKEFELIYLFDKLEEIHINNNKDKIKNLINLSLKCDGYISRRNFKKKTKGKKNFGEYIECQECHQCYNSKKKGFGHTPTCRTYTKKDPVSFCFKKGFNEIKKYEENDEENEEKSDEENKGENDGENEEKSDEENDKGENDGENEEKSDEENEKGENDGENEEKSDEENGKNTKFQKIKENITKFQKNKKWYIKKKVTNLEYKILCTIANSEYDCLPKVEIFDALNQTVIMKYYRSYKIKYIENIDFIKKYIKALLTSIKALNKIGYIHGDIKPNNFLYCNENTYHLIDFGASLPIHSINSIAKNIATFPYIPPEVNELTPEYYSYASPKSDLWSVGIILLFLIIKNDSIFPYYEITEECNQRRNSLLQYHLLYGKKIKMSEKYIINQHLKKIPKYSNDFIKYYIKNSVNYNEDAIDLMNKLLELDKNKRINIDDALRHNFFNAENSVYNQKKYNSNI